MGWRLHWRFRPNNIIAMIMSTTWSTRSWCVKLPDPLSYVVPSYARASKRTHLCSDCCNRWSCCTASSKWWRQCSLTQDRNWKRTAPVQEPGRWCRHRQSLHRCIHAQHLLQSLRTLIVILHHQLLLGLMSTCNTLLQNISEISQLEKNYQNF